MFFSCSLDKNVYISGYGQLHIVHMHTEQHINMYIIHSIETKTITRIVKYSCYAQIKDYDDRENVISGGYSSFSSFFAYSIE